MKSCAKKAKESHRLSISGVALFPESARGRVVHAKSPISFVFLSCPIGLSRIPYRFLLKSLIERRNSFLCTSRFPLLKMATGEFENLLDEFVLTAL